MEELQQKFIYAEEQLSAREVVDNSEEYFFRAGNLSRADFISKNTAIIESKLLEIIKKNLTIVDINVNFKYAFVPKEGEIEKIILSFRRIYTSLAKGYLSDIKEKTSLRICLYKNNITINQSFEPNKSKVFSKELGRLNSVAKGNWKIEKSKVPWLYILKANFKYYEKQVDKRHYKKPSRNLSL